MTHEPIHRMFQRAAERFQDCPAIEWEDRRVTYAQLEGRSNELAESLRESGLEPGSPVAILADRTADVIAAMLGVLKAGCAFVPLDLHFPSATLPAVVDEIQPRRWLVSPEQVPVVERLRRERGLDAVILPLSEGWLEGEAKPARPAPPAVEMSPDALCYIYFTSGSTGRPKAIGGRLKAVDHFVRWEIDHFGVEPGTRVSQLTSPAFDAFLRDVFVPLVSGGTVCVPNRAEILLDGGRLADWVHRRELHMVHCTPSLFRLILGQNLEPAHFPSLRYVLLAGEPLLPADVKRWHSVFGDRIRLVNFYGPSETTMIKLFYPVRPEDGDMPSIPIGQPMPGARAIVIDDRGQPSPPGKFGEIYIRTPYRSLGYLNQPELTREVFIQNPFSQRPDDIVYKTGDLGRVREDGNFEFLGRRDHQVKIRGVRIELAAIESALGSHEAVAEAVVVDRTDTQGGKFLCAYVVLKAEAETSQMAEYLRGLLPDAMVPSAFLVLDALPRTLSGKVDRRALPDPGQVARMDREYLAPRTPAEEDLCAIFRELLALPEVSVRDSFFERGGHSLLATLLLSRIRTHFGVELPLPQIFQTPTVEALALAITQLQAREEDQADLTALLQEIQGLSEDSLDEMIRRQAAGEAL